MILCTCCALAHEYTHQFAAISASRGETDSLDVRKSKIVEELKAKKDSTTQEVVKTFIDTSIAEVNNATDSTRLDSISQLILAKVDGCLEVESKEKAATGLKDIDHQLVGKYYTDIVNAESSERIKALVSDATTIIGLRPNKDKNIRTITTATGTIDKEMVPPSDQEKIAKYIDDINKATNKSDADKAYDNALALVSVMRARESAIKLIRRTAKDKKLTAEDEKALNGIIQDIIKSDDEEKIVESLLSSFVYLTDDADKATIKNVLNYITTDPHFLQYKKRMLRSLDVYERERMELLWDGFIDILNIAVQSFKDGKKNSVGTLGNQQNGPVIVVTDQNDRVIRLYNPKKVEFKKEK